MSTPAEAAMEMVTLPLTQIIPYWRNPRRITDEAVDALVQSIQTYGYQQPIVVDAENVIIMGHTRYSALRRMGVKEIPVLVARNLTPKQVKELRTIDNRTSEYTRWDFEKLLTELEDLDQDLMANFFPEVVGSLEELEFEVGSDAVDRLVVEEAEAAQDDAQVVEFVCPHCFHQWEMKVFKEDIIAGHLEVRQ